MHIPCIIKNLKCLICSKDLISFKKFKISFSECKSELITLAATTLPLNYALYTFPNPPCPISSINSISLKPTTSIPISDNISSILSLSKASKLLKYYLISGVTGEILDSVLDLYNKFPSLYDFMLSITLISYTALNHSDIKLKHCPFC